MPTPIRYLQAEIIEALNQKMVFIGGPRQVGKTTLSLSILDKKNQSPKHPGYFNWDDPRTPTLLKKMELPPHQPLIVLDEIHKYAKWRNLVKGIYDIEGVDRKIIVTGSARLDYYRKGGDSLVNRYRYFRLHPLSLMEVNQKPTVSDLKALLKFSGFPEPYYEKDEKFLRIWQRDRLSRVLREDLRDLERVKEVSLVEQLVELLPEKVGSPLSINSLREDLEVDHKTASRWLTILDNLYVTFRISPYGSPKIRAVKKEQKLYLWDWSMIDNEGARFENLAASQLLKYCHWIEDTEGHKMELRFLRDTDKREVDFVVLKNRKPEFAVECKTGEKSISTSVHYFAARTSIPRFYQIHMGQKDFIQGKIRCLPWITFCKELNMP